jgi:hypothetical protein
LSTYRPARGVAWRCWDDGCVVFSAPTGQTLLLAPVFADVLGEAADIPKGEPIRIDEDEPLAELRAQCATQLVELGVLVSAA